jgi:hypothetical protein
MPNPPPTSIRLDPKDRRALARLARQETALTGSRVTAGAIIRRLIKAHLRSVQAEDMHRRTRDDGAPR